MSTEKIMEQAQVFASAWSVVGGPFDDGEAMDVATQEKDELKRMAAELVAERDALAEKLAELEGHEPVAWIYDWMAPEGLIQGWVAINRKEMPEHATHIRPLYARPVPAESAPKAGRLTPSDIVDALRDNGMYEDKHAFQRLFPTLVADARAIEIAVLRKNGFNPQAKGD